MAPGLYDDVVSFCRAAGFSPRVEQEAIQMQTIISLVSAELGVALIPASLTNLRRTGVIYKALRQTEPAHRDPPCLAARRRTADAAQYSWISPPAVAAGFQRCGQNE